MLFYRCPAPRVWEGGRKGRAVEGHRASKSKGGWGRTVTGGGQGSGVIDLEAGDAELSQSRPWHKFQLPAPHTPHSASRLPLCSGVINLDADDAELSRSQPWHDAGYSFGARQTLHRMFHASPGMALLDHHVGDDYWARVSRSLFCVAAAGWGWGGRMKAAVTRGCIPLIVQVRGHPAANSGPQALVGRRLLWAAGSCGPQALVGRRLLWAAGSCGSQALVGRRLLWPQALVGHRLWWAAGSGGPQALVGHRLL
eukprot:357837-Chlamydomonas_euryale.AAC.3